MSEASSTWPSLLNRLARWDARFSLSRKLAVMLAIAALVSGVATYGALSGWGPFGSPAPLTVLVLLYIDLVLVLLLSAVVLRRMVQLWLERRRGSAGSRLHTRVVALFSVVAIAPAIIERSSGGVGGSGIFRAKLGLMLTLAGLFGPS